jgi:hypothetical protein
MKKGKMIGLVSLCIVYVVYYLTQFDLEWFINMSWYYRMYI